ncbi:unnamed protein product [Cochlearia groenlandica]
MLRWRNLFLSSMKSSLIIQSNATTHLAPFHSTRNSFGSIKILKKLPQNVVDISQNNSSIRFTCTVKEKGGRTTAKKALNNLLFHKGGFNDPLLQNEWHFGSNPLIRDRHMKKKPPPGRGKKPRDKKTKRWHREANPDDDTTFHYKSRNQSQKAYNSRDSAPGFEWIEGWSWTTTHHQSCNEPFIVGSRSERTVLGLPLVGQLNIDDVKNAFRSSALKWHPDKHHGPSQEAAQEKFKLCVDAYKSLCSALSS